MSGTAHLVQRFDSTEVRAHEGANDQAAAVRGGGFSTKTHLKVDLGGFPLDYHLTGGEGSDSLRDSSRSGTQHRAPRRDHGQGI
jgi:hypothetical protein